MAHRTYRTSTYRSMPFPFRVLHDGLILYHMCLLCPLVCRLLLHSNFVVLSNHPSISLCFERTNEVNELMNGRTVSFRCLGHACHHMPSHHSGCSSTSSLVCTSSASAQVGFSYRFSFTFSFNVNFTFTSTPADSIEYSYNTHGTAVRYNCLLFDLRPNSIEFRTTFVTLLF